MRHVSFYLEESQAEELERLARSDGKTKSALIREAVDDYLGRRSRKVELEASLERTAGTMPDLKVPSRDEWDR